MKMNNKTFGLTKSDLLVVAAIIIIKAMFITWFYIPSGSMLPTFKINDRVIVDMDAYRYRLPMTDITLYKKASPERGDSIIFNEKNSGVIYVKRVIGVAGDTIRTAGHDVYINDKKLKSERLGAEEGYVSYKQELEGKQFVARYNQKFDGLTQLMTLEKAGNLPELTIEEQEHFKRYRRLREGSWTVPEGHVFVMGDNRDESLDSRFEEVSVISEEMVRGKVSFVLANMKPLTIGDVTIPFIPASFTDFNRSPYELESK